MCGLEGRFSHALHTGARAWRQAVDRRLKYLGVSHASWMTIAAAAKSAEPLSQSQLADRLAVEAATMVAMVDRLVKAGLVSREPSTVDRRIKHVVITAAGLRVYENVKAEAAAVQMKLLSSIDREQLRVATEVLEALEGMIDSD